MGKFVFRKVANWLISFAYRHSLGSATGAKASHFSDLPRFHRPARRERSEQISPLTV
jgi:hypothetical protein